MIPGETDYPTDCEFCDSPVEVNLLQRWDGAWSISARCSSCGLPYARLSPYFDTYKDAKVAYEAMKGGETWMIRK